MKDSLIINYEVSSNSKEAILTIHRNTNSGLVHVKTYTGDMANGVYQCLRCDNNITIGLDHDGDVPHPMSPDEMRRTYAYLNQRIRMSRGW